MKKTIAITLIMALLMSAIAGAMSVSLVEANMYPPVILPEITIDSSGSISQPYRLINQVGNTYTLTADIQEHPIVIERSNIVFDGAGHTINITQGDNSGLELKQVNNVIVKNITVYSRNIYTIDLYYSTNCLITGVQTGNLVRITGDYNTLTESNSGVTVWGSCNLITRNNIGEVLVVGFNNFSLNNFLLTDYPFITNDNFWDNGTVGNYWGNYSIRYPNASEVGNSGIGNTPFVIQRDRFTTREYPNASNIDHHPLMYSYDIEKNSIMFPTAETQPKTPKSFPTAYSMGIVATIVLILLGTTVYVLKRKR